MNYMAPANRPNQIRDWVKQFMVAAPALFLPTQKAVSTTTVPDVALLYELIWYSQMELTFIEKNRVA
ncbi:hypothetical protein [Spirosoma endbachense]|uniref:Uncharacterized protein n=1 Tax=Spirosoma endbachense TaxID=2666025 RepID=A0A6P1VWI1_9BACT|nr:hypothetical protein [Spirosoma endbachense]QHV96432.1 hypothetical protein GJR95_16010 [Spirosoma endbachense]